MWYLCIVYDDYAPNGAKVLVPVEEMGSHETIEPTPGWTPIEPADRRWHRSLIARDAGDVEWFGRYYRLTPRRLFN